MNEPEATGHKPLPNETPKNVIDMSEEELTEEKHRLARSQGGNPNEETWRHDMIHRQREVLKRLKMFEAKKAIGDNTDIIDMGLDELLTEQKRLGIVQNRNPEGLWNPKVLKRLELIEEKIKILDPNELRRH